MKLTFSYASSGILAHLQSFRATIWKDVIFKVASINALQSWRLIYVQTCMQRKMCLKMRQWSTSLRKWHFRSSQFVHVSHPVGQDISLVIVVTAKDGLRFFSSAISIYLDFQVLKYPAKKVVPSIMYGGVALVRWYSELFAFGRIT